MSIPPSILSPCLISPCAEYYRYCRERAEERRRKLSASQRGLPLIPPVPSAPVPAERGNMRATPYAPASAAALPPACIPPCRPVPLGRLVEKAALYEIGTRVKLDMRRIVRYRALAAGRADTRYLECDGVHFTDYETLCLFEVKLVTSDLMGELAGRRQVERAAWVLGHAYRVVRTRLVYVGTEADRLRLGIPATAIDDLEADFGVVWVSPGRIESAAASLGISLPVAWSDLDARYGTHARLA